MWITLFSPLTVFIGLVVLLNIVYFYLRSYDAKDHSTTSEKLSRRLGLFERFFLTSAKVNNTGYINTALFLESQVKLDPFHVKKALVMLLKRFPLLRMRTDRQRQIRPAMF